MSKISKRAKELKSMGNHMDFLKRIKKSLYYGTLPSTDQLSLPVTELASELFSEPRSGRSLDRLHCKDAAYISRHACVSPCSFVLAMLYLERLKKCNPDYLQVVAPSELFLVSLMVSSKFLHDNGEEDEVFMDEWAASGGITLKELIQLEREFLNAIEWDIFVNESTFWSQFGSLEAAVAKREGLNRGYFTYTELTNIITSIEVSNLVNCFASVVTILLATYTAGILTIVASIYIVSNLPGNALQAKTNYEPIITDSQAVITNLNEFEFNAVDMLQTGILLASIKAANINESDFENKENVTWDWWNCSSMNWLYQTSKLIEQFQFVPGITKFTNSHFIDMKIAGMKKLELEDQIHMGTKIRIQDQLEQSWHKEWTDSIFTMFMFKPLSYFQVVKV